MNQFQRLEEQFEPVERQDVAELVSRKHAMARMFAQGHISESQLIEGSKEVEAALENLQIVAAANGGNRAVAALMLAEQPGGEFLRADTEIQREILRTVFDIDLKPSGPYRGTFDPSTLVMKPKELPA
jgi:predicted TPR repeat methyltransferase